MERRYGSNRTWTDGVLARVDLEDGVGNTVGVVTLDASDLPMVAAYGRWCKGSRSYAVSEGTILTGALITLERLILGVPKGTKTRHTNNDASDYRRSNITALFDKRPVPKTKWGEANLYTVEGDEVVLGLRNKSNEIIGKTRIDADVLEKVLAYGRWYLTSNAKSRTQYVMSDGKAETGRIKLHRYIMMAQGKLQVDHINGDGLDNRKCNLRFVNSTENQQNRPRANKNNGSSGVKNVYFHKASGSWVVLIVVEGKRWSGGYFATQEAAEAKATEMRIELHTHSPENRDLAEA